MCPHSLIRRTKGLERLPVGHIVLRSILNLEFEWVQQSHTAAEYPSVSHQFVCLSGSCHVIENAFVANCVNKQQLEPDLCIATSVEVYAGLTTCTSSWHYHTQSKSSLGLGCLFCIKHLFMVCQYTRDGHWYMYSYHGGCRNTSVIVCVCLAYVMSF